MTLAFDTEPLSGFPSNTFTPLTLTVKLTSEAALTFFCKSQFIIFILYSPEVFVNFDSLQVIWCWSLTLAVTLSVRLAY